MSYETLHEIRENRGKPYSDFFTQQSEISLPPLEQLLDKINSVDELVRITSQLLRSREAGLETIITILSSVTQLLKEETVTQMPPSSFLDLESFDRIIPQPIKDPSTEIKIALLPINAQIIYVGDLHGDGAALRKVLLENDPFREKDPIDSSEQNSSSRSNERVSSSVTESAQNQQLVFLGDYVDRGPSQLQVILMLLLLKLKFPHQITLLRGNHEFDYRLWLNYGKDGFATQLKALCIRSDLSLARKNFYLIDSLFRQLFQGFPIIAISPHGTLATHGAPFPGERNIKSIHDLLDAIAIAGIESSLWSEPFPMEISPEDQARLMGTGEAGQEIRAYYQGQSVDYAPNLFRGTSKIYLINPSWLLNKLKEIPGFSRLVTGHQHCCRHMPLHNSPSAWYVINTSGVVGSSTTILIETNGEMTVKPLVAIDPINIPLLITRECEFIYKRGHSIENETCSFYARIPSKINGEAVASVISALFQSVTLMLNIQHINHNEAIFLWVEILRFLHTNPTVQNELRRSILTTENILRRIAGNTGLNLLEMSRDARGFPPLDFGYLLENGRLNPSIVEYINQTCPARPKISNGTSMPLMWYRQEGTRPRTREYPPTESFRQRNTDSSEQLRPKRRRKKPRAIRVEI